MRYVVKEGKIGTPTKDAKEVLTCIDRDQAVGEFNIYCEVSPVNHYVLLTRDGDASPKQ